MVKRIWRFVFIIMLIILIIAFPFIIEKIIVNETVFPFNKTIVFSKETWFGFVSSYIGAIGTVSLGVIALYQNKKYKELSENSDNKFIKLQEDIKELTKNSVELIKINTKLETVKYFPILTEQPVTNYDSFEGFFLEKDSFQMSIFGGSIEDIQRLCEENVEYYFEHYHTFTITFKNDGERTIRNFNCKSGIELFKNSKDQVYHEGSFFSYNCDIMPGTFLRCVLITKFDLVDAIRSGEIDSIKRVYEMENVIGEKFEMEVDINFYRDSEAFLSHFIKTSISLISKIE